MRFSLLLLASIATLSFAQQVPPAPTMLSVVQNANNQFATLTWTASYTCPDPVCWFSLYRDAETDPFNFEFDRGASTVHNFPVYFGEEMGYGTHSFYVQHNNFAGPSPSSNVITVTFTAPPPVNPPSDIVGDPQFMGLKGQVYQVHGAPNEVFNIISDVDLQYNSKFVYLDAGDCPTMDGETVDTACFTHPGTYLGELGLETQSGDRVYIKAGAAQYGLAAVKLNGKHVPMNELIELSPSGFIIRNNSHVLTMQAGNFRLEFTNSDMFVNQVVEMLDTSRTTSHGLLGQSWSTKVHNPKASIPWIEGTVWDYEVEDHKVFSNKFTFNKFTGKANSQPDVQSKAPASIAELKKQVKNRLLKNKQ